MDDANARLKWFGDQWTRFRRVFDKEAHSAQAARDVAPHYWPLVPVVRLLTQAVVARSYISQPPLRKNENDVFSIPVHGKKQLEGKPGKGHGGVLAHWDIADSGNEVFSAAARAISKCEAN